MLEQFVHRLLETDYLLDVVGVGHREMIDRTSCSDIIALFDDLMLMVNSEDLEQELSSREGQLRDSLSSYKFLVLSSVLGIAY